MEERERKEALKGLRHFDHDNALLNSSNLLFGKKIYMCVCLLTNMKD